MEKNKLNKQLSYSSDKNIILSYSSDKLNHGICGHLYEVIDYYFLLNQKFSTEIIIGEYIPLKSLYKSLKTKYKLNRLDLNNLFNNIKFIRPIIYNCPNSIIIFTEGNIYKDIKLIFKCKKIILFPCDNISFFNLYEKNNKKDFLILHDTRLKYEIPEEIENKHYIKKINFNILKDIDYESCLNQTLIYATSNCRLLSIDKIKKYNNSNFYYPLLILINKNSPLLNYDINDNIKFEVVPINNLMEKFKYYIYTSIERKWDCSNRLLAECKWYKKQVILDDDINEEYLNIDLGLKYRLEDINNNFESLFLTEEDDIINICENILKC